MNILAAIKREEKKLEKQMSKFQHQLNGIRSAAKALGHSAAVEVKAAKKRVLSTAGRAAIAKAAKRRCEPERDTLKDISWSKAKEGYANIERLYGTVNLKNNRYAYMAYMSGDKAAAQQAFALIGDNPDHNVWHDQNAFDTAKSWATAP